MLSCFPHIWHGGDLRSTRLTRLWGFKVYQQEFPIRKIGKAVFYCVMCEQIIFQVLDSAELFITYMARWRLTVNFFPSL